MLSSRRDVRRLRDHVTGAAAVAGLFLALSLPAHAAPAFGPKEYVVTPGLPLLAIERFPACQPEAGGQMRIESGPGGRGHVSLAVVVLNQRETVVMLEAPGQPRVRERAVKLAASNTLLVWMIGPPGAALSVSVASAGACLDVAITSPPPGASVPEGMLQVRGIVEGPADVGVAVNGIPAAVHGSEFVAMVPVLPGPTELAAIATTPDGSTAEAREPITVVEAAEGIVGLLPNPPGGPPSLAVRFSLSSLIGLTDVKLDVEGDGSIEFEGPDLQDYTFIYEQPGIYMATVHATDIDGQTHSATAVVEVYDLVALDHRLQAVWGSFKDAARQGDVMSAASLLHSESRDAYADQLRLLRPQTLAAIDTYLTSIAEYEMLRDRDGTTLSFAIWFRVDQDGIWRLFRF
jgi:hypothetical protein